MDDLLADFIAESREMMEKLGGEMVAWEAAPGDGARLDAIFRFVHTVKGNCGFFDLPRLERLSHSAEDALGDVRAGRRQPTPALVDAVLAIVDRISALVDQLEAGQDIAAGEEADAPLIAALDEDADAPVPIVPVDSDAAGSTPAANPAQRSIRLSVDLLDRVMSGVSDLVLARNDMARQLRDGVSATGGQGPLERLTASLDEVRDAVSLMRMQRLETLFSALPRLVRDLAKDLGKQVMIDVEGGETELDREMIESIRDPLVHIVRNALDHGIESPGERLAQGKREIGLLSIGARQAGNQIAIIIRDDGRGIDTDRLVEKAIAAGVIGADEAGELSRQGQLDLIFHPGLSTAETVSAISGRGVGMDVVRSNVEAFGGSIEIMSQPGTGTTIYLRLPLTLSIVPVVTVISDGVRLAIPQSYVEEIVDGAASGLKLARVGDSELADFRNARVPCLSLRKILGQDEVGETADKTLVFVELATRDVCAFAVDSVVEQEDMVVKPVAPLLSQTRLYAGASLSDAGEPTLLLDIAQIAWREKLIEDAEQRAARRRREEIQVEQELPRVLLCDTLDGERIAVRMGELRRIETIAPDAVLRRGKNVQLAIEGQVLPLEGVGKRTELLPRMPVLRLGEGTNQRLHAVARIIDAAVPEVVSDDTGGGTARGTVVIDGKPVSLLTTGMALTWPGRTAAPACALPTDNEYAHRILAPLVEQAGYRLIAGDADEAECLTITIEGEGAVIAGRDAPIPLDNEAALAAALADMKEQRHAG